MRSGPGRTGRWTRSRRWCSWTPSWSRSATTTSCRTSPPTSRSASTPTGRSTCWASGWPRPRRDTATAGEGARFWASVMTDLRNRGVRDILIACCDGLAGFEDAIGAAFPATVVQTMRRPPGQKRACGRWPAATPPRSPAGLRTIYTAPTPKTPRSTPWPPSPPRRSARNTPRPSRSGKTPGTASPRSWPSPRRCASCSTPPTASSRLNYQLRKVTKARGHFPGDDAVVKLLWLAIINIEDKRARERAARRARNRQAQRPARTPHRRTTRHGLARSTQRTRHRLPRTNQVKDGQPARSIKDLYTPEVTSSTCANICL